MAAADSPQPIEDHVHAARASGDIGLEAMLEFVLHFAVYWGWPKASHLEGAIARQRDRIHRERGEQTPPWPQLTNDTLGPGAWDERLKRGVEEFIDVNLTPAPPANSPYRHAGILGFVFGHVWQRPGLTRRERRIITVASASPSTTRPSPCRRTSGPRSTPATSPRRRWTRSCCSSPRTTA
ncbi:hypothetical protein [Streptomyces sp. 3213.3]|uniref:hypothetical protein n=1 Tax=Streptomyces sp. 3213.3 TaxID=1855348 RepID=UPI000A8F8398